MADTKLSALSTTTTLATGDLLYAVTDPGGLPASKGITTANLATEIVAEKITGSMVGTTDAQTLTGKTITLGGDLTVNGNSIVSASNGDINVTPNGSGDLVLTTGTGAVNVTTSDSTGNATLLSFTSQGGRLLNINQPSPAGNSTAPFEIDTSNSLSFQVDGSDALQIDLNGALTSVNAHTFSSTVNLSADSVDAITEIAAALKSGSDGTVITGTAGTSGVPGVWNADGDLVDATDTYLAAGKTTLWVPAAAMTPATTSGPATGQIETTTNKVNVEVLDFDTSADEYAHFNIAFPKSWDEGTVTFQLFWTAATGGTTGVAFGLQGVAIGDNTSNDTAYGTAIVVTDDAQTGANEIYVSAESSAVTIANTPAVDEVCFFRLFRDVSDANDDLAEDARLVGIKLFFTTDAKNDA